MTDLFSRQVAVQIIPQLGTPKLITKLRVQFKIKKTNKSSLNNGEITILNMNEENRSLVAQQSTRIVLLAGYRDTSEVIAAGNITKVVEKKQDVDWETKIEVRDGDNAFRTSIFNKSFPPDTSIQYIFDDLINESGFARGSISGIPTTRYKKGYCYSGMARDAIDELCEKSNLEWSVQNETIQIMPKSGFTLDTIIELDQNSGLIESPSKTKNGIEFKSLLQPRLTPGRRVKITSDRVNGVYKILTVLQDGDSEEGPFYSICEASK